MSETTIVQKHARNFETLKRAFRSGNVALLECKLKETGEEVAVIVAVSSDGSTGEFTFTPFAMFFNGNPYELLAPPNQDGGFFE